MSHELPNLLATTPQEAREATLRVRQVSMFGFTTDFMRQQVEIALKMQDAPKLAMSMISDAQEEASMGLHEEARQTLNRAKWVLANYVLPPRK